MILLLTLFLAAPSVSSPDTLGYEAALTAVLQQVVTPDGLVRYDRLRTDQRPAFDRVLHAIETADATRLRTDAEKLAFWLNAYNVRMLKHLVDAPDVRNIERAGQFGPYFRTPVRVAGRRLTLDQIENVILRRGRGAADLRALQPSRLDPRLHVGLNCGAVSCPRLRAVAFTPATVDAELDQAMRDWVNDPAHFDAAGPRVRVSKLLDWFNGDFDATGLPAGDFLLRYLDPARPDADRLRSTLAGQSAAALRRRVAFMDYRWDVNAAR